MSGSSGPAFSQWWSRLDPTQRTQLNNVIKEVWKNTTGLHNKDMATRKGQWTYSEEMVQTVFNLVTQDNANYDPDTLKTSLTDYMTTDGTYDGGSGIQNVAADYNQTYEAFKSSFKKQIDYADSDWAKKYWTEDKLQAEFGDSYYDQGSAAEISTIVSDVGAVIDRAYNKAKDAGAIDETGAFLDESLLDPTTGEPLKDTEIIKTEYDTKVKDIAKRLGFELSEGGVKHFADLLKKKEADEYGIEQLMRADPGYLEAKLAKDKEKYLGTLPTWEQEQLNIIDQETAASIQRTEEQFKQIAPGLGQTAKQLGGRTRDDTFITDTLAKSRADMETNRQAQIESMRLQARMGASAQKAAVEAGSFDQANAAASKYAVTALQMQEKMLQEKLDTQQRLADLSTKKSSLLATRAYERYQRNLAQQQKRELDAQQEAQNKAFKKARQFGSITSTVTGALTTALAAALAAPTGGASLAALAGGLVGGVGGYASSVAQNKYNVQTPSLNYSDMGTSMGDFWTKWRNRTSSSYNSGSSSGIIGANEAFT